MKIMTRFRLNEKDALPRARNKAKLLKPVFRVREVKACPYHSVPPEFCGCIC